MQNPLASSSWDSKEIEAIQRVISSGRFTMGEEVLSFEKEFSRYIGSSYSVMVNSGSSANLLSIAALFYIKDERYRLKRGDEVIVPAVSWSTTYFPLLQYGLKIKFVDIDCETLNLDLHQLTSAISDRTKLIMAVNLLGNPLDYDQLNSITSEKKIFYVEDNCESLGSSFRGKMSGTFGLLGTFSFFYSHHISTMEGGMITTDNRELYHILLSLRSHGWTRNLPKENLVTSSISDDPFMDTFRFILPGYNLRPLEMSGAIGREQIKKLPDMISIRRDNATIFTSLIAKSKSLRTQKETGISSWFGFPLILKEGTTLSRQSLLEDLKEQGFETRPIVTGNFTNSEVLKYFDYSIHGNLNNAEYIDKNSLFIGNHPYPLEKSLEILSEIIC